MTWKFSLDEVAKALPEKDGQMRFHYALRHGSMKLGLYGPRARDVQEPHKQDEIYVITQGACSFVKNGERRRVGRHDVLFVEAGAEHRFEDVTDDFLTWVIFWGPEGGEAAS
jgi:mannose-6-phosphate isomerase-like protein (cupin superfamily)